MISKSYATTVEKKMCMMKKANVGNKGKDKTALQSGISCSSAPHPPSAPSSAQTSILQPTVDHPTQTGFAESGALKS
ncbi:hypothetical protein MHYP_G00028010 [Metynnis hypsauchen]